MFEKITRKDRTSQRNGIVGVIMKVNGSYDWFKYSVKKDDGCKVLHYHTEKVFPIINNNRFNQDPQVYSCSVCKCVNALTGSYIAFVEEDDFLADIDKYIDNAFEKSENDASGYKVDPTR